MCSVNSPIQSRKSQIRLKSFVFCVDVEKMIVMMLLLIVNTGSVSAWSVTFENSDPCALKGSSVVFGCSYNYTVGETITKTAWFKGELKSGKWIRTSLSTSKESRAHYIGDKLHNCSLAIHDLQDNDTGYYYFRFDTDAYGWRSRKSVHLSVTELSARVNPNSVKAGDNVTLECGTSCQLPPVWFKDGHPIAKTEFQAQIEDAGEYSCAVKGQESMQSDVVALDVQSPPLNVSVEVSHSGQVSVGSSVNLTCSSAANPAADSYTWYKRTDSPSSQLLQVGSGQVLSLPSVEASHTGFYHCQARNLLGKNNSPEVLLTVDSSDSPPLNVSVEVSHSGQVSVGSSVNLTCSSAANPAADSYTWYKRTDSPSSQLLQVGSGQVLSLPSVEASHTGFYHCQARNLLGKNNSPEVLLTVDSSDIHSIILLVGIGVIVVIVLLLLLVIVWAWRRRCKSAADEQEDSHDYENISTISVGQKTGVRQMEMKKTRDV